MSPPWPRLADRPVGDARAVADVLGRWRDAPGWAGAGLRLGIVNVLSDVDPTGRAPTEFATRVAWSLVTAAYDSARGIDDALGPVFTAVGLAPGHTDTDTDTGTAGGAASPPRRSSGLPGTHEPYGARTRFGRPSTVPGGIAAVAHAAGLTESPAARLLVLISDASYGPEHLAQECGQADHLLTRGCGVLWLRTNIGHPHQGHCNGEARGTAPDVESLRGGRVMWLDPTEPVPGQALGAAALDAMNRAELAARSGTQP
ncbi:hypothetical protein [Pseudonocardia sp. HH130630-07]|uniref:hypothetical protein n=1 Tax=Pseudonocardia sp. HH130630-07 TaxID=1690815 RepID=UPI000814E365|nr:hypothetical protein [Pseudonocardia sp. HH130630-07]ANY07808.1 hypothetical protein AFB00_17585 [Pseudonocardia sp. HH130630-07]